MTSTAASSNASSDRCSRPCSPTPDGNQIRAAALLGINRNTLRKKIVRPRHRRPGAQVRSVRARTDAASSGCAGLHRARRRRSALEGTIRSNRPGPPAPAVPRCPAASEARDGPRGARLGRRRSAKLTLEAVRALFFVNDRFDLALACRRRRRPPGPGGPPPGAHSRPIREAPADRPLHPHPRAGARRWGSRSTTWPSVRSSGRARSRAPYDGPRLWRSSRRAWCALTRRCTR